METGGGPLPGATRVEVDAEVGAEGIDRRESAAVGAELSGRGGWRGGNSAGPASVVARLSPGTGRRSKDVEVNQPGDVRQRLRWISSGGGHPIFFSRRHHPIAPPAGRRQHLGRGHPDIAAGVQPSPSSH
uniref:Uncharacterized protein n=1 Tax=Oryza nivara TaxID=4536 RepID=A0A0E0GI33_ORYNI